VRVASFTRSGAVNALETVAVETPESRDTSYMVGSSIGQHSLSKKKKALTFYRNNNTLNGKLIILCITQKQEKSKGELRALLHLQDFSFCTAENRPRRGLAAGKHRRAAGEAAKARRS